MPEIVDRVIAEIQKDRERKARDAARRRSQPGFVPSGKLYPDDGTTRFLASLPPVIVHWVLAIVVIGVKGVPPDDIDSLWETMEKYRLTYLAPERAAIRIIADEPVEEHLREGLRLIAAAGIDLDAELGQFPQEAVKAA
jgi:hypothetical protein